LCGSREKVCHFTRVFLPRVETYVTREFPSKLFGTTLSDLWLKFELGFCPRVTVRRTFGSAGVSPAILALASRYQTHLATDSIA
jgi:hypothetical protein